MDCWATPYWILRRTPDRLRQTPVRLRPGLEFFPAGSNIFSNREKSREKFSGCLFCPNSNLNESKMFPWGDWQLARSWRGPGAVLARSCQSGTSMRALGADSQNAILSIFYKGFGQKGAPTSNVRGPKQSTANWHWRGPGAVLARSWRGLCQSPLRTQTFPQQ